MEEPTRRQAIKIIEAGHAEVRGLIDGLPRRAVTTQGIGRGAWSPKDVIGHIATWEGFALEALDAWEQGKGWHRESELWTRGVNPTNRQELERSRRRTVPDVRRRADAIHEELLGRLRALTDTRWKAPPTARGRRSLGGRLGGILGGPAGPFRHNEAHLRDLRSFAAEHSTN
jgi:hypothetical protein